MATSHQPQPDRTPWADICRSYPERYVAMIDVEWVDKNDQTRIDVASARVIEAGDSLLELRRRCPGCVVQHTGGPVETIVDEHRVFRAVGSART